MSKKLNVIIPVYNALDDVKRCLQSLKKNFNFDCGDIVVIDDCSNSDTACWLNDFCSENEKFRLLRNDSNLGFLKTCNRGFSLGNAEFVVLLNSDTIVPECFAEKIIKCFEMNPAAGVASPIQYADCAGLRIRNGINLDMVNKLLEEKHVPSYPLMPYAEGYCFLVRRSVFSEIGGFNEAYGKGYHEEVDYSFRVIKAGFDCILADNMCVYHRNEASFGKKQRAAQIAKNDAFFESCWGDFCGEWKKEKQWKDPLIAIEKELFPLKLLQRLFSRKVIYEMHDVKIVYYVFGFKIKRKIKEKKA